MTEELRAKVENKVLNIAKLVDEICESVYACEDCPLSTYGNCAVEDVCNVAVDIREKRNEEATYIRSVEDLPIDYLPIDKEPTYEQLPIDLDDDYHCDECCKPISNGCCYGLKDESECPYGLGECCDDNLATNVGRICFDHNVPQNVAMAIIEIIQKERDRNEYLHIYREHIPAE